MAEVVLFHSALGVRPGVHAFADRLREDRHVVHVPDLYDGAVFDDLDDGLAHRDALGIPEIVQRAIQAVADLPLELVYAGFSLGASAAQMFAQTRPRARGALLYHSAIPAAEFDCQWPAEVPLEVHTMDADPWVELDEARELVAAANDGALHLYPGSAHLFADPGLRDNDQAAALLLAERTRAFLRRVG